MPRADDGAYWDTEEPAKPGGERMRETHEQTRVRRLEVELRRLAVTLEAPGLIDLDVKVVADALAQRKAIEYMIGEMDRRRQAADDERRARAEEEERQRGVFRAALESDAKLRREVESRNSSDKYKKSIGFKCQGFGPLPGGFPDGYRKWAP